MVHRFLLSNEAQTLLPSGFGITVFGLLTFTQGGGSILIHFLLSLGGAILIATAVRYYRIYVLDKFLPLKYEDETSLSLPEQSKKPVRKRKSPVK